MKTKVNIFFNNVLKWFEMNFQDNNSEFDKDFEEKGKIKKPNDEEPVNDRFVGEDEGSDV